MAHETVDERDHAQHHCSQTGDYSAIVLKNEAMPHCTKRTCAFHSRGCWSHTHEQDGLWGMRVHESITLSPPAPFHRPPWVPIPDQGPYTDICCWLTQKVPVSSPAEVLWAPGLAAGGCCPLVAEPMPHGMGRHVLKRVVLGSLGLGCGCRAVAGTPACQLHQLCPSTRALRITWGPGEAWRVCVPWASECRRGQGSHLAIRDTSSAFPLGPGETQCV